MKPWVRKWVSRIRFQRLRSRFLAAMIALSIPPLFILGYVSFNISKETLKETNAQTYEDHLKTSSEVADLLFRNVVTLNRSLVLNANVRDDLISRGDSNAEEVRERTINRLKTIINNNLLDLRYIDSLCLLDMKFNSYCVGRSDNAGQYEGADKEAAIESSAWYQKAYKAQGRVVFFGYNVLDEAKPSFSTVKLYRNSESAKGEPIGLLVMNLNKSIFDSIFNDSNNSGGFIALDDSQAPIRIIFQDRAGIDPPSSYANAAEFTSHLKEEGYLISRYRNPTTQWTFLHAVKEKELVRQSNRIGSATTIIASIIALVALIISYIVSGSITRPLLQLKKMMVDWTKGARTFQEPFEQDEVGAIGETFKRMASENEELALKLVNSELKEREAELRALQAQIKPHFLYNTLDSIYWMATLQQNHQVAQMAVSLSESFKLSLNKGKELIPVYKELKHIEHYMTIQNIRYNDRFTYTEEVDPSILTIEIMKLLLQPLVENAIYHGLEKKIGAGAIRLTGIKDGEFLVFTVEDDGVGIEDMSVVEHGYGLRNVKERLLLFYGASSTFTMTSKVNEGTKVEIRFRPLMQGGDTDA